MNFKKHIPNFFTLLNLLAGSIAAFEAANGKLVTAAYWVFLGIIFDYFDGFLARILKVHGELGKQLDSLADVVTSGVVPGIVMFQLIRESLLVYYVNEIPVIEWEKNPNYLPYLGFLITLSAAYRLANFNIDERQTESFIGLPTPAASLFVISIPLILAFNNTPFLTKIFHSSWILLAITIIISQLMNTELPLFALKFKNFSWKLNRLKYSFVFIAIASIIIFQFVAIPLIIILYVLVSFFMNRKPKHLTN